MHDGALEEMSDFSSGREPALPLPACLMSDQELFATLYVRFATVSLNRRLGPQTPEKEVDFDIAASPQDRASVKHSRECAGNALIPSVFRKRQGFRRCFTEDAD